MVLPSLRGPNGQNIDPSKVFIEDGHGSVSTPLNGSEKDFAIPAYMTVASIISGAQRTYLANQFDEALKHSYVNARAMYRDCRILGPLEERIESVVNLKWHLEIPDEKDEIQQAVRDGLTTAMRRIPRFKRILRALMKWGLWSGRGCSHLCWDWWDMELPKVPEKNLFDNMNMSNMRYGDDFPPNNPEPSQEDSGDTGGEGEGGGGGQMGDEQKDEDFGKKPDFELEGRPVLMPFKNRPVNGDKINYIWGYTDKGTPPGTPIVRVHGAIATDVPGAEVIYDNMGPNIALTGEWRERFVIHTYDPDDADYYAPEMAGGIHGVGLRSRIYWLNWIRMEYAAWIQDLYDRVGLGFIVIKYDMASAQAKSRAEDVAKKWNRRSVIAVPVSADQLRGAGTIEIIEAPTSGAVLVQELIKYLDKQIERYILRQTSSGGGGSQGDGMRGTVGPTEMAKKTEIQRIKADAEELAETITGSYEEPGILSTMMRWTYPGLWDDNNKTFKFPIKFVFEIEDESPKEKLQTVTMASSLGVKFRADDVRALTGMEKPDSGDETVGGQSGSSMGGGGGHGDSASRKAAQEWIAEGKPRGKLQELADNYQITRQSIGQEAKRMEGGAIVEKYEDVPPQPIVVNVPQPPAPIVNVTVPEIKIPEIKIPEVKIPEIKFPESPISGDEKSDEELYQEWSSLFTRKLGVKT